MAQVTIPASIDEATTSLNGLGQLLKAKEWERAAIVYAFTRMDVHTLSTREFAALGITGLTDKNTVSEYRRAWESAMADGAPDVKPGDTITLPTDEDGEVKTWPPGIIDHKRGSHATTAEVEKAAREMVTKDPQVLVTAMKVFPKVADAVVAAIVDDKDLAEKHGRMSFAKATTGKTVDHGPASPTSTVPTFEREKEVTKAIDTLMDAIRDEQSGGWTPGPGLAVLLFLLTRDLNERATRIVGAQPVVHAEIDAFLAANRKDGV